MSPALLTLALANLAACDSEGLDPDWFHWDVSVVGVADACHTEPVGYAEDFTYSLEFVGGGSDVVLRIGEDPFGTGTYTGCKISYDSGVVREERGDSAEEWVQWRLTSVDTTMRQGGDSCGIEEEIYDGISDYPWSATEGWDHLELDFEPAEADWFGFETFEIRGVGAEIEDLEIGCEYTTLVAGTYISQ